MNGKEAPSSEYAPSFEKQEKSGAKIAYIAEELPSLTTVFYLFLEKQLGNLADDFQVIPRITTTPSPRGVRTSEFISVFQTQSAYKHQFHEALSKVGEFEKETFENIDSIIAHFGGMYAKKRTFERLRNYVINSVPSRRYRSREVLIRNRFSPVLYDTFCGIQLKHFGDPTTICKRSIELFSYLLDNSIDPVRVNSVDGFEEYSNNHQINQWLTEIKQKFKAEEELYKEVENKKGGVVSISFPKFIREKDGSHAPGVTKVEKDSDGNEIYPVFELPLSSLRILERECLSIVVVGPPNSGKTSLVASLLYHSRRFIEKTKTLPQFSDLNLNCGYVDLDEWTPDARRLLSPELGLERKQRTWDQNLASSVFHEFLMSKNQDRAQIIFADAPGGELKQGSSMQYIPGEILKTVITPADGGIVVTNDWNQQTIWRNALRDVGIPPIAMVSSRRSLEIDTLTNRTIDSTITQFKGKNNNKVISGRIVGLNREVKLNDDFIEKLVPMLLLDILPGLISTRRNKIGYRLQTLALEQGIERLLFTAAGFPKELR
ncbi:MAG TPA: hypothetical protein VIK81_01550 [Patescibacteria group bacterium]